MALGGGGGGGWGRGTVSGPTAQVGLSDLGLDSLISSWHLRDNGKRPRSALRKAEVYTCFAVRLSVAVWPSVQGQKLN